MPESSEGERLLTVHSLQIMGQMNIAPKEFVGKKVSELNLYQAYNVHYLGIKEVDRVSTMDPDYVIQEQDKLILSGHNKDLEHLATLS